MKRWPQLLAVVAVLIITGTLATLYVVEQRARREEIAHDERAARYDAIVTKYSVDLKPGLTRKEIKDFLRVRGGEFFDSCCSDKRGVFATLTKIGDEPKPWFCSAVIVYAAFEFEPSGPDVYPIRKPLDLDTFKYVHQETRGEGCL